MKKIKVGIIGFGMAGRVFHAPLLSVLDGFDMAKIRETKAENIKIIKSRYPDAEVVQSSEEIFNDRSIDLVVLAVPNRFHHDLARQALEANKHVVVEKPFTVSSKEADELISLSIQKERILTIYHNRRWDSDFTTVKKVIQSGMLGDLVEYESHFDRFRNYIKPNTWKEESAPGGGILYDLGSHLIDQALILFGLPESVTADIRVQRPGSKVHDNFELILHYKRHKATIKSSMLVREPMPKYILHGMEGSYIKYGMDVQEAALESGMKPVDDASWGLEPEDIWGTINTTHNGISFRGKVRSEQGNYLNFYKNLHKTLNNKSTLEVDPIQARNTIRIIELAIQSNERKCTVSYSNL